MNPYDYQRGLIGGFADALRADFFRIFADLFSGFSNGPPNDFEIGESYDVDAIARSGSGQVYQCILPVTSAQVDPANDAEHWQAVQFTNSVGNERTANKGRANGYAPLDGTGKVPASYLSVSGGLSFVSTWDASTGDPPTVAPANGQYWLVSVAGDTTVGGFTDWTVGMQAVYQGDAWHQVPATVPPASGISNDSTVGGNTIAAALDRLLALAGRQPWVGANTKIGSIAETAVEHVVVSRAPALGQLAENTETIVTARIFIPDSALAGIKHFRVCADVDTTDSVHVQIPAATTGVVVITFVLLANSGSIHVCETTVRINNNLIAIRKRGNVNVDFSAQPVNLQLRGWLDDEADSFVVDLFNVEQKLPVFNT